MSCSITVRVYLGLTASPPPFTLDSSLLNGTHVLVGSGTDPARYVWTEVTDYVESTVTVTKGGAGNSIHFRASGGRASFVLTNYDGRFDPLNAAGPHYSTGALRPGLPVKVTATPLGGAERTMFVGRADRWPIYYLNNWWSDVRVTASDDVEALTALDPGNLALNLPVQTTTARCESVLSAAGWPDSLVSVEASTAMSWEQQTTDLGQSAWAELQLAADSGDAWLWVDAGNVVRVKKALPTSPVATFGNGAGLIPAEIESESDPRVRLVNQLTVRMPYLDAGADRLEWTFDDHLGQSVDGVRSWARSDLMTWPGLGLYFYGATLADRWSTTETWSAEAVTVAPETAAHATTCLNAAVGELIEVRQDTPDGRTVVSRGYVSGTAWRFAPRAAPTVQIALYPNRPPDL